MKRTLILLAILFFTINSYSQFSFSFAGSGTCPTQGATLATQPSNATVSEVTRTNLACASAADCFNSSGWNLGNTIDLNEYIEVSITAASGYVINAATLSFATSKSSTGPANGKVMHDGGTGTFTEYENFAPGASLATVPFNFTDFTTAPGATLKFRIYGWNAGGSSGTMRIDDLTLNAAVTASGGSGGTTLFTYDNTNALVGLGKTPTQTLDVLGTIRASDKLLIGNVTDTKAATTLSSYALIVNGSALFTKAEVQLSTSWPDYVFDEKYALLSIPELEKYIKTNKHLPGVVPASEAEKKGIDIAVTQASLLEKIEELTLYIISQHKQIEELKRQEFEITFLKQRIEILEKSNRQ